MGDTTIDRALWNVLRPQGDPVELTVTSRPTAVDIEGDDGRVQVSVYAHEDGVDIRVANTQLVVKNNHVALLQGLGDYPRGSWALLWEGDLR